MKSKKPSKEWIEQEYIIKNRTQKDICEELAIGERSFRRYLEEYNLNNSKENIKIGLFDDKDWLFNEYINLNKSEEMIAKEQNVSRKAIKNRLNKFGIKKSKEMIFKGRDERFQEIVEAANLKRKKTCLESLGVDSYSKTDEFKKFISKNNPMKNKEYKENFENSILNKYGVRYYTGTKEFVEKSYDAKTKNGTHNTSKPEDDLYEFLLQIYPDIVRQYKSKLYPFNCDYYIPLIDLYIELQGRKFSHGTEPFNPLNEEHIKIIEEWGNKKTENYDSSIYNWTIRDPLKRQTAKDNNLKYLEIFDYSDFGIILNEIRRFE